ncbi:MAG: hypothetical protein WC824_06575 [Bacteroidota bacterium]|jgi:hypothetical protein
MTSVSRVAARYTGKIASLRDFWVGVRLRPPGEIFAFTVTAGVKKAETEFLSILGKLDEHGPIHYVSITQNHEQLACTTKYHSSQLEKAGLKPTKLPAWSVSAFDEAIRTKSKKQFYVGADLQECWVMIPCASTKLEDYRKAAIHVKTLMGNIEPVLKKHGFQAQRQVNYRTKEIICLGKFRFPTLKYPITDEDVARWTALALDLDTLSVDTSEIKTEMESFAKRLEAVRQRDLNDKALLKSLGIDHIEHNRNCSSFRCLTGHQFEIFPIPGTTLDVEKILKERGELGIDYSQMNRPNIELNPNGVLSISYEIDSSD